MTVTWENLGAFFTRGWVWQLRNILPSVTVKLQVSSSFSSLKTSRLLTQCTLLNSIIKSCVELFVVSSIIFLMSKNNKAIKNKPAHLCVSRLPV